MRLFYLKITRTRNLFQDGYLSGNVPFEAVQLDSAISSVIFEIIGQEESVGDAAFEVKIFDDDDAFSLVLYLL